MQPTLIDNGKQPDEPYNVRLGFWLPPDSPYGNLQLKLIKLISRLDEANRRLIDSFQYWTNSFEHTAPGTLERHWWANEQAVYLMRRSADELIALTWCLDYWEQNGKYPHIIKVDSIGRIRPNDAHKTLPFLGSHIDYLECLNEVSNAFKHSFVHSGITLVGRDEPCVHALAIDQNRLAANLKFHNVSLRWLAEGFTEFYSSGMDWMAALSARHR